MLIQQKQTLSARLQGCLLTGITLLKILVWKSSSNSLPQKGTLAPGNTMDTNLINNIAMS